MCDVALEHHLVVGAVERLLVKKLYRFGVEPSHAQQLGLVHDGHLSDVAVARPDGHLMHLVYIVEC